MVKVIYNESEITLSLVDKKVHLPTVERTFHIQQVQLNGRVEPVNNEGFTYNEFDDGTAIVATGVPGGVGRAEVYNFPGIGGCSGEGNHLAFHSPRGPSP